ncbi:MAG: DUF1579 domain-containing protein [Rhizomicrobium sp.]
MKFAAALILAASLAAAPAIADTPRDHAHDFDFLIGKWKVHHWRLNGRLVGSHDWVEFDGTSQLWMTMDGHGTVDDNYLALPSGPYRAVGIRGYDPKTQTWAIWWLDGRNPHKMEEPPVIGNFDWHNGVGTFEGGDVNNGKPVIVRYTWSKITKNSAHWEQAESPDHGKTWEVNWRMDFTRVL